MAEWNKKKPNCDNSARIQSVTYIVQSGPSSRNMLVAVTVTYVLALMCLVDTSETKTVVSIPYPFTSHTKYHTNVARVLAKRGHNVWVTMPTYLLEKGYLNTSGFEIIPYDFEGGIMEVNAQKVLSESYFEENQDKLWEFIRIAYTVFDTILKNDSFTITIQQKKPDLIVIDNLPLFYAMSVIPYKLGIPFAFLGSIYYAPYQRIPFSPADVPVSIFPYSNKMTFIQRLQNTLFYLTLAMYNPSFPDDAVLKYAPEMEYISLRDLAHRAEIFLVEHDYVLDYPKPTLPNVKLIGGTVTEPTKALPSKFQYFMDNAKEGVVIVSLGSYVINIPKRISDKIFQVLMQLPMKSIFRSTLTSPDPGKILTAPWIPQNDLLGHPHTKVFVSHCGKNGQYEALYHAVPMVAVPLFLDQPYNAERARTKGFAETLDLNTCTVDHMKSTILMVATEPRYKQAVVKHSRLFKELYGLPMEKAVYWLEHVMEYGGDYMRAAGQQMPFYQYALLDVFFVIFCVLALAVGLVFVCIKTICRCIWKRKIKSE